MAQANSVVRAVLAAGGRQISGGEADVDVATIHVLEEDADLERCGPGALVVLTAAAASGVRGFRFEALLARAAAQGVAVLVIPTASVLVAPRFDPSLVTVSVVTVPEVTDLGPLITDLARVLTGRDSAAVVRLQQGLAAIKGAERGGAPGAESAAMQLSEVLTGLRFSTAEDEDRIEVEALDPDHAGRSWSVPDQGEPLRQVDELLLRAMTAVGAAGRMDAAPSHALSTQITELLVSRASELPDVSERCRSLGFDPDGWHLVAALRYGSPGPRGGLSAESGLDEIRREERMRAIAMGAARTSGASWHWAQVSTTLLLVCSWSRDPGRAGEDRAIASATNVYDAVVADGGANDAFVTVGVSRVHQGLGGLRLSATEARSSMRATNLEADSFALFDEFGLDLALLDWFSLESSRESARRLLAPLRTLQPQKAEVLMRTLQAYLDHQGSLSAAAGELFIHRNAVSYRMATIRRLLDSDLSDPQERLALQLACRGRRLLIE